MELYHVLNRGVDKRVIFNDSRDYARFIHDLYEFNTPERVGSNIGRRFDTGMSDIGCHSFQKRSDERLVDIHFFCLMPNHYHLLLSPVVENGLSLFMKKMNMGYAKYFNERNERSGSLFQGKYKSVHVTSDAHFLYLPFYIHLNPLDMSEPSWRKQRVKDHEKTLEYLREYRWSSHLDYLGTANFPSVSNRTFFTKYYQESGGYKKVFEKFVLKFDSTVLSRLEDTMLE